MPASDPLILCYHACSPTWDSPLAVSPEQLGKQIQRLLSQGFAPMTFSDAVRNRSGRRPLAVTFDDAYINVFAHARPVLDELGVKATVFVPTGHVGLGIAAAWGPAQEEWIGTAQGEELVVMDWAELRTLRDSGWEIGSHSHSHRRLTTLSPEEVAEELTLSRQICLAELEECNAISYPFGAVNPSIESAAVAAGYTAGAAVHARPPHSVMAWPRVDIYGGDGRMSVRISTSRLGRQVRNTGYWRRYSAYRAARAGGSAADDA
jgi:peptidoglycan/xylan/chitin deacetylase (PgdA/CDA1 family)